MRSMNLVNRTSLEIELVLQGNLYEILKVLYLLYSSLAQSVEHAAVNRSVVGSSPTGGVEAQWLSWLERRPVTAEVESSSLFWVVNIL